MTPALFLRRGGFSGWMARLVARPDFQSWAGKLPFGSLMARRTGAEIFDVLQGFVASQVLAALIELGCLRRLLDGPLKPAALSVGTVVGPERMKALLQAGAALGLLHRHRDGRFSLGRKGAAILGVPGLEDMIRHNRAFYADMSDPVALLSGKSDTELARFWPYVFGQSAEISADTSARYSDLMARSQGLVAQDTLRMVDLNGARNLLDIGGGAGVFLEHVLRRHPDVEGGLFDLPNVIPVAEAALGAAGFADRVSLYGGSFRGDPLPTGADTISLVRVLYDHDDGTVAKLLRRIFDALPPGGRLIVSEPMSGGTAPDPATDVYFAFYTMAMGTGQVRSARKISNLCAAAGFRGFQTPKAPRPYITSVLTCRK